MDRGKEHQRMHHRDDDWRYHPAGETFIVDTPTPSVDRDLFDEPSFSGARPNPFAELEKTPANSALVRRVESTQELRAALSLDLTKYFAKIPHSLTVPAAYELARHSDQDIQGFEDMYRVLDGRLKEILVRHVPAMRLPTFSELMEDVFRGGTLSSRMQKTLRDECGRLLHERLFFEVTNHLTLFAAFAENIANAWYIKRKPPGEG